MSSNRMSPNQREALSTVSTLTNKQEYLSSTNNKLNVNSTATLAGSPIPISGATTAVGVAIVDGSGNQITSFGGGTQYSNGSAQATPTGTVALGWDTANVRALSTDTSGKLNINTVAGTVTVTGTITTTPPSNASTNIAQINGVTPLMGNGVTGTGSLRVTVASDNTPYSIINADPTTTDKAKIAATQRLRVAQDGTQLFYEAWDAGIIETVYNWNSAVMASGATSVPSAGQEVLSSGTTANAYAYLRSKNTFQPSSPGYIETDHQMAISTVVTHGYGFWGIGIPATTPTSAAYATDAIGFEVTAAGVFNAVTWAGGAKNIISALSLPGDTSVHRYQIYMRGDSVYWVQDNVTVANIQTGALGPNTNLLPVLMLVGNDASGSTGFSLTSAAVYLGDTTKASTAIGDPTHPQLKAIVTTANSLQTDLSTIAGGTALLTGNGLSGAGSPRVTIASNSTPLAVGTSDLSTVAGDPVAITASGVHLVSIAGPTGDALDTQGNSLRVVAQTGQNTSSNSVPVTIASDQSTVATIPTGPAGKATVFAPGELRVSQEAHQLFNDTFDFGLDTIVKWKSPISTGTALPATNAVGATVLSGGTIANNFSSLESAMSFQPTAPGYLYQDMRINIEYPVLTTAYRFWGVGLTPGVPTVAAPVIEGSGWDIGTTGRLSAVMYASGTRNLIADLSKTGTNKQPTDSSAHKYFMWFRGDQTFWAIDSLDNIVASTSTGAPGPNVNFLPLKLLVVSNGGTAATITLNGLEVGDTSGGTAAISDGLYRWRQATVTSLNALKVDASATVQPVTVLQSNGAVVPFDNVQQVGGNDVATVGDGVQLMALAGPTGDIINTVDNAVEVAITRLHPASNETSTMFNGSIPLVPQFATIVASASGATTIIAAQAGYRIRILSYVLTSNGTVNVKFQSHTLSTDLTGLDYLVANTGVSSGYSPVGHFQTNIGEALDINLSASIAIGGHITYVEV